MRADKMFAERFGSRSKAQEALKKGLVTLNGKRISPHDELDKSEIERCDMIKEEESFVSNGGYKLARGLSVFCEDVSGATVCDLGSSTGGFCDCLLKRGAKRVFCVDVGVGQLEKSLAFDPRVTVMDGVNARYLRAEDFPCPIDCVTGDLSFISLKLLLPAVSGLLEPGGRAFLLFKPQFECGPKALSKRGICPRRLHAGLLKELYRAASELGLFPQNVVNAPLKERKNVEYLVLFKKDAPALPQEDFLRRAATLFETADAP